MKHFFLTLLAVTTLSCKKKSVEIEEKVSEWIKLNANNPDSYNSISFSEFQIVNWSAGNKYYRIRHNYQLLDKTGELNNCNHLFVLTKDFYVSIITESYTSWLQSVPPSVFEWTSSYGEKFLNVDYGGLDTAYFNIKYEDYKALGKINDFKYLNKTCSDSINLNLELESIKYSLDRIILIELNFQASGSIPKELESDLLEIHELLDYQPVLVLESESKDSLLYFTLIRDDNDYILLELSSDNDRRISIESEILELPCFME